MYVPKTLEDIKNLIENTTEESYQMEFKGKDALDFKNDQKDKKDRRLEIAKDVSAFANSAGGVIIYGIKEDKSRLPILTLESNPILRERNKNEQIEQIINQHISPKIEGLKIHTIQSENPLEYYLIVEIPQSTTAHQNTKDKIYYKRYNFSSSAMLDYEVKDVMNRAKHPIIDVEFEIIKVVTKFKVKESKKYPDKKEALIAFLNGKEVNNEYVDFTQTKLYLKVFLFNRGSVLAEYAVFFLTIPSEVISKKELTKLEINSQNNVEIKGTNTSRDLVENKFENGNYKQILGPSIYTPILPKLSKQVKLIELSNIENKDMYFSWKVYADNSSVRSGSIKLNEIKLIEKLVEHN